MFHIYISANFRLKIELSINKHDNNVACCTGLGGLICYATTYLKLLHRNCYHATIFSIYYVHCQKLNKNNFCLLHAWVTIQNNHCFNVADE